MTDKNTVGHGGIGRIDMRDQLRLNKRKEFFTAAAVVVGAPAHARLAGISGWGKIAVTIGIADGNDDHFGEEKPVAVFAELFDYCG